MASYPSAVAGMNDFFRLKEAGAFPADAAGMSAELEHDMFYAGKAAIWMGGSYHWQEMMDRSPAKAKYIKVAGFPIPQGSKYTKPLMTSNYTAKGSWLLGTVPRRWTRLQSSSSTSISPTTLLSLLNRQE